MTTFKIILLNIPNHLNYEIFKKILLPCNIDIWQGGLPKSFYFRQNPPPPLPPLYCDIALLLSSMTLIIYPDTNVPRCPTPGSFHLQFHNKKQGFISLLYITLSIL